ncbi:hypothetical protein O6U65_0730 [Saccharomyces cerevisiae synthetic construct]|uniref:Putative uncharacterized protein YER006C-A n=1 Tax=Saccharomyces cerevisiae (strain ATCC 204508 / S288c) TaxID=559292 RepID=YE006_YEAST|nr:RecName: Full=Putative uncharacterized protein YER006C-A [Saccharomyces cerevisiae S288C]pir/S53542/ hypothetical protein YER006c-a - yeast (Saccharomyces cerevisiae) [Saccharomyces cerevisiae]AHX39270.1 hypothetical protein YER006C-A [Saccharomyces cerevisiae]WNV72415.1 hypothetical protein O6U65_0730 [Saccharomyces cerevisiae synthetic construct]
MFSPAVIVPFHPISFYRRPRLNNTYEFDGAKISTNLESVPNFISHAISEIRFAFYILYILYMKHNKSWNFLMISLSKEQKGSKTKKNKMYSNEFKSTPIIYSNVI